jgi:hypothetical protein
MKTLQVRTPPYIGHVLVIIKGQYLVVSGRHWAITKTQQLVEKNIVAGRE